MAAVEDISTEAGLSQATVSSSIPCHIANKKICFLGRYQHMPWLMCKICLAMATRPDSALHARHAAHAQGMRLFCCPGAVFGCMEYSC